jgi:hypothetical protein
LIGYLNENIRRTVNESALRLLNEGRYPSNSQSFDEKQHREALNLPIDGKLEISQIKTAFRKLAQKAYPDAGGGHEQFVRITEARNVLLECVA